MKLPQNLSIDTAPFQAAPGLVPLAYNPATHEIVAWVQTLPQTAPGDADIEPGQIRAWFDPATDEIVTRGRREDGALWTRREAVTMD